MLVVTGEKVVCKVHFETNNCVTFAVLKLLVLQIKFLQVNVAQKLAKFLIFFFFYNF